MDARREKLERRMADFPIVEYGFLPTSEIEFSDRVRLVCQTECMQYGTSWACPPAVGTVKECRQRCMQYTDFLVFTTMAEVSDISNMEETLATRADHEDITRNIRDIVRDIYGDCLALSTESCAICPRCSYLDGEPCRFPKRMMPCVESHAIIVTQLAERAGLSYFNDYNTVIWFSAIFFNGS